MAMTLGDTASVRIAKTSYARYVALRRSPEKPTALMAALPRPKVLLTTTMRVVGRGGQ